MKGIARFLLALVISSLLIGVVSAENWTNYENFNESIGMEPSLAAIANYTGTTRLGVIFYQPVEQVYDRPWMPLWLFLIFFIGGVIGLVATMIAFIKYSIHGNPQVEIYIATIVLIFLAICYVTQPFIVEQGVVSHFIPTNASIYDPDLQSYHFERQDLIVLQPYSFALFPPYLPQICQIFFWWAVLNWFLAMYHLVIGLTSRNAPLLGGKIT